jgi:hypothetical protein
MHHNKFEHPWKSEQLLIRNPHLEEHKLFAGGSANRKGQEMIASVVAVAG